MVMMQDSIVESAGPFSDSDQDASKVSFDPSPRIGTARLATSSISVLPKSQPSKINPRKQLPSLRGFISEDKSKQSASLEFFLKKKRKLRGQVTYQLELLSLSRSLKKLVKELMKHEARRNLPMT